MHDVSTPAYWWVNQGTTFGEAREQGYIWAPKKNRAGKPMYHWDNMERVETGDVIFHYASGNLKAISRATSNCYNAQNELHKDNWAEDGWRVDTKYCVLNKPIPIARVGTQIAALPLEKGPVNRAGGVNQGYLFELPPDAVAILIEAIGDDPALRACEMAQVDLTIPQQMIADRQVVEMSKVKLSPQEASLYALDKAFIDELKVLPIIVEEPFVRRFVAAVLSKRFLILTGLAGSGKTKLAQAFARWISPEPPWLEVDGSSLDEQLSPHYALVPVGADWTGNENIIGYPDGLQEANYISKPALDLIRHAVEPNNAKVPHFLILDEMNLSHVERYFADLLSAIESGEAIPLYAGTTRTTNGADVPHKLRLPDNLFVIGTVNVDETTYMFSPKVLDRANVIEFCVTEDEMTRFLEAPQAPNLARIDGRGSVFGEVFVDAAADKTREIPASVKANFQAEMLLFFKLLQEHNAEFGYRTGYEAARFVHFYHQLGGHADDDTAWFTGAMDAVIVQKLLPKLHGSRSKLEGLLWALAWACGLERVERNGKDFSAQIREACTAEDEQAYGPDAVWNMLAARNATDPTRAAYYPLSFDKVMRMWRKLVRDQFVSFAEA